MEFVKINKTPVIRLGAQSRNHRQLLQRAREARWLRKPLSPPFACLESCRRLSGVWRSDGVEGGVSYSFGHPFRAFNSFWCALAPKTPL